MLKFLGMTLSKNKLILLNHCVCPGQGQIYECTACGGGLTEWSGSLFECQSRKILLRHGEFRDDSISGQCHSSNGAVITAQSIGPGVPDINMNESCYTSQLHLQNMTASDNNKTVACHIVDDQSERAIGNITVTAITGALDEKK